MNFLLKVINCFLCILLPAVAIAQYNTTNDWDQTTAGKVRQVIQNRPHLDGGDSNYPGLMICEYPAGSGIEHLDEAALFFGGIVDGETRVTAGESWCKDNEVWPGSSPWDSVWVVLRGDSIDIGGIDAEGNMDYYWPGYTPVSDQDFIARYDDYNIIPSGGYEAHRPLFLDIVQQTFNWSTPLLENVVLWSFYITPTKYNVEDMYITLRYRSNIAPVEVGSDGDDDDRQLFFPESDLLVSEDMPDGVDGTINTALGFKIIPPKRLANQNDIYTFYWGSDIHCDPDAMVYDVAMESHQIMENQQYGSSSRTWLSMGPFELVKGDTVVYRMAQIIGNGIEGVQETAEIIEGLAAKNFKFPIAPPAPPLRVETQSKQVKLTWNPTPELNPEEYIDQNRADGDTLPFEGYRIYKSTQSADGPWTPIAQFDIAGDEWGLNNGLQYEYIDKGLLNNTTYYYTVASFSKPDLTYPWPSEESSLTLNAVEVLPGFGSAETVGKVAVVPNPYRGDINYYEYNPPWEKAPPGRPWMKQDRKIQFINLPTDCVIKVFSVSGDFIKKIEHHSSTRGFEDWNLTSYVDQAIASGLYFFTVKDLNTGDTQVGKFVVIK